MSAKSPKTSNDVSFYRPPRPKGRFIVGNIVDFRRAPLTFLTQLHRDHGDLVEFTAFRRRFYLLSDPERMHEVFIKKQKHFTKGRGLAVTKTLLGEGLLTSEGDFHLRQRRLTQPAFHRRRISSYADTMVDAAVEHMKTWRDGQSCDIHEEMVALTLDIVGRTLFGADVAKEAGDVSEAVDLLLKAWWIVLLVPALNKLRKVRLPIPVLSQVQNAIDNLDDIIYRLIRERRESGEDHGDLLSK